LSKKCFEKKLCREKWTTYLIFTTLWYTCGFQGRWMNWMLCIHLWTVFSNHHGLLIIPKTWTIHVFFFNYSYMFPPLISTDIWQYTVFVNNNILFRQSIWIDLAEEVTCSKWKLELFQTVNVAREDFSITFDCHLQNSTWLLSSTAVYSLALTTPVLLNTFYNNFATIPWKILFSTVKNACLLVHYLAMDVLPLMIAFVAGMCWV
jgi:hypothetical protein